MSTRSGGPQTPEGKAVTRYNAATHGIYSVTPVVPAFERQDDWLDHRLRVFTDLDPDGYLQEIVAERIALNSWRLRRLVRYERERVRSLQRDIPQDLAFNRYVDKRKPGDNKKTDMEFIDRLAMSALIPSEKDLNLIMRYEGRLTRQLRLDMLHLEHMKRQRREPRPALSGRLGRGEDTNGPALSGRLGRGEDTNGPLLSLAEPEPLAPALRPGEEPESQPIPGYAERDSQVPATRPAEAPESRSA